MTFKLGVNRVVKAHTIEGVKYGVVVKCPEGRFCYVKWEGYKNPFKVAKSALTVIY